MSNIAIKQLSNVYYTSNYIIIRFSLHFHEFLTILSLPIFFSKISADISDISVKSKYQYIRDYRYFHLWMQVEMN